MPDTPRTNHIVHLMPDGSIHDPVQDHRMPSPTMPDTLTPDELAAIREEHERFCDPAEVPCSALRLLAHIDALTAAVEGLTYYDYGIRLDGLMVYREEVLAILRGEP